MIEQHVVEEEVPLEHCMLLTMMIFGKRKMRCFLRNPILRIGHQSIWPKLREIGVVSPSRIVCRRVRVKLWPLEGCIPLFLLLTCSQLLKK